MNTLAIYDIITAVPTPVLTDLKRLTLSREDEQITLFRIGQMAALGIPVLVLRTFGDGLTPYDFFLLEVQEIAFLSCIRQDQGFVGIRETGVVRLPDSSPRRESFPIPCFPTTAGNGFPVEDANT